MFRRALVALMGLLAMGGAGAPILADANEATKSTERRQIVVISDLHFGLGKKSGGAWDRREDFRWTRALAGFLDAIGKAGGDKVDLVIAGDFLELWQPPDDVKCDGADDAVCNVSQMRRVVRHIIGQHGADLKLLADFAKRGSNQLIVVPGNHDAALLIPDVWAEISKALNSSSGRVVLIKAGVWASQDGQIVVEHGHQIGADVNAFQKWPQVTKKKGSTTFVESPWGERFVQKLFNAEEVAYPIIDNLSPESYGARLRLADRGLWRSTADVARFVAFNLFETTIAQKLQSLGEEGKAGEPCTQQQAQALGYRLFASALPDGDPFKEQLQGDSEEAAALRRELDELTKQLSADEAAQICRQRKGPQELGALLEGTFIPRREVMGSHARLRLKTYPSMKVFVYAHTHQLESAWSLPLGLGSGVTVANTGAFQRLLSEDGYKKRLTDMKIDKPSDGLSKIPLELLAPCYSFVEVPAGVGTERPVATTRLWRMSESDAAGSIVAPGDAGCR